MNNTNWIDPYDSKKYIAIEKDYIVARGGDGTLLKAINMHRDKGLPFVGFAGGTLNFLMNEGLKIRSEAKYKSFNLIKVKVTYENLERDLSSIDDHYVQRTKEYQAFNEICLGGDMGSWIEFNVHDHDKIIGEFKGGGVIVSTAQGSTGINKNNNGVILPLSSKNWSITGDKTNRKVNHIIEPKRTSITCKSRTPVTLWIDGTNEIVFNVTKIEISKGDSITVIFNDYDNFKRKRRI